jgi:SAM-dependent methyltransferase
MPVTTWMIDAVDPQPGQVILDLAAGIGDVGFFAAELVAPGGQVMTGDFVPEMLAAAQRRAEKLGIANVRFRQMDANVPLDQPAASLDGVLCRWGYMLFNDGEAALRETRRVLKQGGTVALEPDPDPGAPGQFAWAREGAIAEHLESAGFVEHRIESVNFQFRYSDAGDWWDSAVRTSTRVADADSQMDPQTRAEVLEELAAVATEFAHEGGLVIPARTWVAAATV